MEVKKENEREELHRTIWSIANDLRGSVDGWDFKQYVLGMLFYRYISESIVEYINKNERKINKDFNYANLEDDEAQVVKEDMIKDIGFFILPSELFSNIQKKANEKGNLEHINEDLSKAFKNIEASSIGEISEKNFKGLFDDIDVNSNKLGGSVKERNERLVKLINGIALMNLTKCENSSIDTFGDAYEFLMGMYASNAGKSGGEYFTPQEVSELLAKITVVGKKEVSKVYDPAVGSGSLLLKFAKVLGKDNVKNGFFGQEINLTTYNLCRINLFLHDIGYENFLIEHGDTLINPKHEDKAPFEAIVSNPPYSIKWEGSDNATLINDKRFSPAGVLAPKSKADFAFIMHSLYYLDKNGTAAIVTFPGIMYRSGKEKQIRKYLVENNYIDAIIGLPENLFYGTSIATCIMVLKKNKKDENVLFVDASKEAKKVTNNNRLTTDSDNEDNNNVKNILSWYEKRQNVLHIASLVSKERIMENDYNLSVLTYVEKDKGTCEIDIKELNNKLKKMVAREMELRNEINKIIFELEGEEGVWKGF